MKISLLRDLTTERNKEQEESFENTMNPIFYFDFNKTIDKVDGWSFSNVKKLVKNIPIEKEIIIYYSKWNQNVNYIYKTIKPNTSFEVEKLNDETKKIFIDRDMIKVFDVIKKADENPNMKMAILLLIAEITNSELVIEIINRVVNGGILSLQMAIDMVIPILIKGDSNE